ncbi:hypothetical protein K502DRAFT_349066 [Neoconidiobolus thromboides FSU 785]|nr:hypothetical protein K502DRAFT_349066 [Neoconidiobolus thromboides FSU 785]
MRFISVLALASVTLAYANLQSGDINSINFAERHSLSSSMDPMNSQVGVVATIPKLVVIGKVAGKKEMGEGEEGEGEIKKMKGGMPAEEDEERNGTLERMCRRRGCRYSRRCCRFAFCRRERFCRRP